ncbi:MAG: hypothetical protein NPIRA02_41390 [Nitrospirales bacterium]|nr:MAG: hypothetical protein NPIRA02_41390 [Nitrospirales bacterium]
MEHPIRLHVPHIYCGDGHAFRLFERNKLGILYMWVNSGGSLKFQPPGATSESALIFTKGVKGNVSEEQQAKVKIPK